MSHSLPSPLQAVLDGYSDPYAIFPALLPPLCEVLQTDRCFLYLRNPATLVCKTAYCYRRKPDVPDVTDSDWRTEPDGLIDEDPLYAAAMRADPSVYVEDVETAAASVVNVEFERQYFGHRALIHAHLCEDGVMWGILQPCVFGSPRHWSDADRAVIAALEEKLTPLAIAYIKAAGV
ncbi:MAG: GAF domain-containing protein [Leptolyngbyaceae cyanobacterium SL_7_1]|nr:GAF domain-containing protein [Leptolyngbyaceae cyanobacterium SL_7_1]